MRLTRKDCTCSVFADKTGLLSEYHDEDVEVYLNGVKIYDRVGYATSDELIAVPKLMEVQKKGKNTFAVNVKQTGSGQYILMSVFLLLRCASGKRAGER